MKDKTSMQTVMATLAGVQLGISALTGILNASVKMFRAFGKLRWMATAQKGPPAKPVKKTTRRA